MSFDFLKLINYKSFNYKLNDSQTASITVLQILTSVSES